MLPPALWPAPLPEAIAYYFYVIFMLFYFMLFY